MRLLALLVTIFLPLVVSETPERRFRDVRVSNVVQLSKALREPYTRVWLDPGTYESRNALRVADHVRVEGAGKALITGHCLSVEDARDVVIAGLTVEDCEGDAIGLDGAGKVYLRDLTVKAPSDDGLIDIINSRGPVRLRRVKLIGEHKKCMLIGNPNNPNDSALWVELQEVEFIACHGRTPKVHFATVVLDGISVSDWRQEAIDIQLGGMVISLGIDWHPGHKSHMHRRVITSTGGRIIGDW